MCVNKKIECSEINKKKNIKERLRKGKKNLNENIF